MKVLKTKKRYLAALYGLLRNLPPSKVETMEDIRAINREIRPAVEKIVGSVRELQDEIDILRKKYRRIVNKIKKEKLSKKEEEKEIEKQTKEIQRELDEVSFRLNEINDDDKVVELELENKPWEILYDIIQSNIKTMFRRMEDVDEFDESVENANSSKKSKKSKKK